MPLLKDLVPGSKSDRLSFHSENVSVSELEQQQDIMEEGVVPSRPSRVFTPKSSTPNRPTTHSRLIDPSRSRSTEKHKSGASETLEGTMRFNCLFSFFSTIFHYLWTKLKRTFKEEVLFIW